jgi:hypothetical protein
LNHDGAKKRLFQELKVRVPPEFKNEREAVVRIKSKWATPEKQWLTIKAMLRVSAATWNGSAAVPNSGKGGGVGQEARIAAHELARERAHEQGP